MMASLSSKIAKSVAVIQTFGGLHCAGAGAGRRLPMGRALGRSLFTRIFTSSSRSTSSTSTSTSTAAAAAATMARRATKGTSSGLGLGIGRDLARDLARSAFVSASIGVVGDLLVQYLEQWKKKGSISVDWQRAYRMLAFRFFVYGPTYSLWLRFLERRVNVMASTSMVPVVKTAMDQLISLPSLIFIYYVSMAVLEGPLALISTDKFRHEDDETVDRRARQGWSESISIGVQRAKEMTLSTWAVGIPFWSVFAFVNFKFVPLQYRMLYISVIQVGWNAYISNVNEAARQRKGSGS